MGGVSSGPAAFTDIMVDLETLGSVPGCAILSIGAVPFNPVTGELAEAHYGAHILRESCAAAGLHEDPDTLAWWARQEPAVSQQVDLASEPDFAIPLPEALADFAEWIASFGPDVRVWGNGADFDNAILAVAFRAVGVPVPWKFYNGRCYRTLKNLRPAIKLNRIGSHHYAIDDAYSQAAHAIELLRDVVPS